MNFSLPNQFVYEIRSVVQGYPAFVFAGRPASLEDHLPVFVYHTIEPARFERDLTFLVENGYRSLCADELVAHVEGREPAGKAVVLTFDDARSSFWRYAFPLLQRYGLRGVLYAIPGVTQDATNIRSNLLDAWDGRCSLSAIAESDPRDETLCTWPELAWMYESGVVDIQSHSLFHREVFVGTEVVDVIGPSTSAVPYQTPITPYLAAADAGVPIVPADFYGLPLLTPAPLFQGLPAWELDDELRRHARSMWNDLPEVARRDGTWRRRLRHRWASSDLRRRLRRQDELEVERRLVEDASLAMEILKRRLGPRAGDHFCLPYAVGSDVAVRVLNDLGVKSIAWGVIQGKRHNRLGDSPYRMCRIKSDFIHRLPGTGRRSLLQVYGRKVGSRVRGEPVY
jgi:hypothetical protein